MKIYLAPLEGITGYTYRRALYQCFGGFDKYFIPFILPNQKGHLSTREKKDIMPENNEGMYAVPQILTKNAEDFIRTAETLQEYGYKEVNLNLGCPSKTVVTKGRGAGFLDRPDELDKFLDEIFQKCDMKISIKTRLGMDDPKEFEDLLTIYNKYPLEELIVHARVQKDYYKNTPRLETFGEAVERAKSPVCYNGDIVTAEDCTRLQDMFPTLDCIMTGRGTLKNPALAREIRGGAPASKEEIRRFHDMMYNEYCEDLSGDRNILFRMKELWSYLAPMFTNNKKYAKKIKKAEKCVVYENAVRELFGCEQLIGEVENADMEKILDHYNSWKLGHKLLCAFTLASIIPLLLIQIFAFQVNRKQMTEKIDELMVSNLTQIAERVNLNMEVYTNLLYQIYKDEQVIDSVTALTDDQETHKAVAYNQIVKRMKQYRNSDAGIRCLSIICPDGLAVTYDFETDSSLNTIWNNYSDMRQAPPYCEAVDAPGMVLSDTMRFEEGENLGHFFHISKRLFDFDDLEKGSIATVVMSVDQSILSSICGNGTKRDNSINFIMNQKQEIISYPDEDFTGISINPDLSTEEFVKVSGYLKNKKIALNQYEDADTGWIFCNAYDRDYMLRDVTRTQGMQLGITVLLLSFALVLIIYTIRNMDASVKSVVQGMQEVKKGNLDVLVPVQSFDEIGTITDNFNEMTVKVRELIREVTEAQENQKNAEIRALEAQINPHFLYNTLDSINWMAIEKEEYEISKMIRNLGVILRYSINKSNQIVTIRELADWLEKYISLQQMRFNDAFAYRLNIDEETYDRKVYKLLLQPFVENAIIHGFKEMESGGLLQIDIMPAQHDPGIVIIIEDNGKGMPQDMLKCYNDREEAIKDEGRSIGLHNAFSRMNMYYGEKASWNVSSMEGMGTVITLRLPVL